LALHIDPLLTYCRHSQGRFDSWALKGWVEDTCKKWSKGIVRQKLRL
jgi:hypothetical protein